MASEKLLPCPFCGSRGIDKKLHQLRPYPYCTNCGANGPIHNAEWNSRASLSQGQDGAVSDALKTADSWLERWAKHVGSCEGGDHCTCGLTRVRFEVDAALRSTLVPPSPPQEAGAEPVEAAARALCKYADLDPDAVDASNGDRPQPMWMNWEDEARIALRAAAPYMVPEAEALTLDEDELDTIEIIGRNEQSGRVTNYEIKELVRVYRAVMATPPNQGGGDG